MLIMRDLEFKSLWATLRTPDAEELTEELRSGTGLFTSVPISHLLLTHLNSWPQRSLRNADCHSCGKGEERQESKGKDRLEQ